jgi:hypothetical protein
MRHLALARRRHAQNLACDPAISTAFQCHGNQFVHAKGLSDWAGHKLVGGRNDKHLVSIGLMRLHQGQGLGHKHGLYDRLHEVAMRRCGFYSTLLTYGIHRKAHVVVDVQRARLVLGIETLHCAVETPPGRSNQWWW